MVMLNIKLKGITKCSSMVANILPADPALTLGMGSIGQNTTFSEHDHKGITKCISMVANILPADPALTLGMGSIGQNTTFSEHDHVAYQIKGNHQMH